MSHHIVSVPVGNWSLSGLAAQLKIKLDAINVPSGATRVARTLPASTVSSQRTSTTAAARCAVSLMLTGLRSSVMIHSG